MTTSTSTRSLFKKARQAPRAARCRIAGKDLVQDLDSEAGDTLIEVLIALVVLGVAVVAMLLAFGAALTGSGEHRTLTNIAAAEKTVSQQIAAQLQNANPPLYSACASAPTYQTGASAVAFTLPSGYSAQVTSVGLWDPSTSQFDLTQAACNSLLTSSNNQSAPQYITTTLTYPNNGHSYVYTVVNNPNPPTPPAAGAAAQLSFHTQPGGAQSAQTLTPQPVVEVQDSSGDAVISDLSTLTLTLTAANGGAVTNGATLSGCVGHENFGYVSFAGCSVATIGTYEIKATDSGLPPTYSLQSSTFTITTGPPSQIVFTQQPGASTGGTAFAAANQPQVTVEDAGGNVVTNDTTSQVSLAVTSGSGTLTCTTNPLTVSAGIASFAGCSVNTAGTYTLTATDVESTGTLTATSSSFIISVGPPAQLAFTTSPGASTSGTAFTNQPVVAIEDAGGNIIPTGKTGATDSITIAVKTGAGTGAGTVGSCSANPKTAAAGSAAFAACKITATTPGTFQLSATDGTRTLPVALSNSFTVASTTVAKLLFATSPSNSVTQISFPTQPIVWVEDSAGDLITTATNTVALTINTGTGTLTCTSKAAVGGIATFSACSIKLGTAGQFTLKATSGTATGVSNQFSVAGTATQLAFTTQPSSSSTGGVNFAQQPVVTIEDAAGLPVTNNTSTVALAITGTTGATLSCTSQAAVAGVATFTGCNINKAGTGYTLKATDTTPTNLTSATSSAISITVGPAATLTFSSQPGGGANAAVWTTQPSVIVQDAGGNTVTTATNAVSLTIGSQPGSGASLSCTANPVTPNLGVATFAGCSLIGPIGSYKLTASASGLTNGTSSAFSITVGTAAQVAFTTQPNGGGNTATWTTQPVATIEDSGGNKTTSTASVTLAIAENAGGALACTHVTVAAVAGVATFAGCKITGTAGTYSLSVSSGSLSAGTSNDFTISAGPATQVAFSSEPGGGGDGAAWSNQPAVSVEDVSGNLVSTSTASITLSIQSQPGAGATLGCANNPLGATGGVATFTNCQITGQLGNYTISAAATGLTSTTSTSFAITVGSPSKLAFTSQPGGGVDGSIWIAQPSVAVEDAGGNIITSATNSITLAVGTNPGGVLGCTTNPLAANSGVAGFAGCQITGKTGAYTLTATATGLSSATSASFTITIGAPSKLGFTTQPSGGANAAAFGTQPSVAVEDAGGNTITTATNSITLAIGTNPGGTLACTANPKAATGGSATFAGCAITGTAGSYTLSATTTGLAAATSSTFNVTAGTATKVVYTTQPGGGADGAAWGTQPTVAIEDASGNVVTTATNSITLAIGTNPGGTLACTANPKNATGGSVSFTGCEISGTLGNYTLTATATGLATATSNSFPITIGAPSKLAFTTQPGGGANAAAWGTQPSIAIEDAGGNIVTTATNSITLAIGTNAGGTLACTTNPKAAAGGSVSFAGCAITGTAGSYTLTATATGLSTATSTAFNITAGTATKLVYTTQPGGAANSATFGTQPTVTIEDASGNRVTTATNSITLAIGTNPGGTLACTANPSAASGGSVTFAGCAITGTAGSYTLTASATGLATATSSAFNITAGTATKLVYTTQPSGGANAAAFGTQPTVAVEDASGNIVTTATNSITLAIGTNPGGTLACTANPKSATGGSVTFAGCAITGTAGSYTLTATATGLASATSSAFNITAGTANKLVYTTQPGGGATGAAWGTQPTVAVEDTSGNLVTTATNTITLAIGTNAGGTLACTANPKAATGGSVSFAGCAITGTAGSYTITAAGTGLVTATSSAFNITPGTATKLVYTTQPSGGVNSAAFGTQPTVAIEDASGNIVTTATNAITLAIGTNPGGTLACTANPKAATGGSATFAGCAITGTAGSYTLTATATGLATATSSAFNVTAGTATKVVYTTQPGGGADGAAWGTQPTVAIEDASGNIVTTATNSITLAIGTNPGGTLACTANPKSATGGSVSFSGCEITGKLGTYTVTATATGLATATSNSFSITIGTATQLAFNTEPGGGANAAVWGTQPTVAVEDTGGNTVPTATTSVSLAIITQPGTGAALACTANPKAATAGSATFAGCAITGTAGSYTLSASGGGLVGATSTPFNITVGTATKLGFTTQSGGGANASAWGTQPTVAVEDSSGNVVTTATNSITLAIGTNPGGTLACTANPKGATGGSATFAGCAITGTAGSYTLTASATGLAAATSSAFNVTAGTATKLVYTTQPSGGADGAALGTQPTVAVEDASGNIVTTATNSITLAVGTNPGGTLACTANPNAATGGSATFAGCAITGKLGTYTVTATATGLATATSNNISITIGTATQLAFTTEPGGGVDGQAWGTQPAVAVQDAGGNTMTTATTSIGLTITTQPGSGATLACTANPKAAVGGLVTFAGCQITGTTGSYTLSASGGGLNGATSTPFTITVGAATKLGFTTQPSGGANTAAWGTQPTVAIEDVGGNPLSTGTNSITLGIGTNPGGTLACTANPKAATGGSATYAGCKITGTAGTYTLTAAATGLAGATSSQFSITAGAASQILFTTSPAGSVAEGTSFTTQPVVTVEDGSGNPVTTYGTPITLSVKSYTAGNGGSTSGAVSGCTNPLTPTNGVASFSSCTIAGTAAAGTYTLQASSGGFTATSATNVTIVAGTASQLVFTTQPGGSVIEGTAFTQPTVTAEDANGNTAAFTSKVTLSIAGYTAGNGGTTAGTLGCTTNPLTPSNSVAAFAGCKITGTAAAGTYTFQASGNGLTSAASASVAIVANIATQIQFTTQPGNGTGTKVALNPQPVVSVEDANGNVVTTATNKITLALGTSERTGATLNVTTNPVTAAAGAAAFSGVSITHSNGFGTTTYTGWTLTAAATGFTTVTSSPFTT